MTTEFCYADIQGETGFPLSLVCWNDLAEELARYGKGDTLTTQLKHSALKPGWQLCARSGPTWNNGVRQSSAKNRYSHPQLLIAINLLLGDIFDILLPGICHLADVSYAIVRYYNQINQPRETAITNDRRKYHAKLT
jgi:hypothetical protein